MSEREREGEREYPVTPAPVVLGVGRPVDLIGMRVVRLQLVVQLRLGLRDSDSSSECGTHKTVRARI